VASSISSEDEVGKLVDGRVVGDVRRKGKVVLEDGAPVRGRIRHLERYKDDRHFVVSIEFTEVQAQGVPLRFYADLVSLAEWKNAQPVLKKEVPMQNTMGDRLEASLSQLPGLAAFFVSGKTFVLPPGLRTVWQTRALPKGAD
jgi:hypothetical protein